MASKGILWLATQETNQERQNKVIQQLMEGRTNATGTLTLSGGGATFTSVTARTAGRDTSIFLFPQTATATSASAFVPSTDVVAGAFTVHHSSSTSTDRIFYFVALG